MACLLDTSGPVEEKEIDAAMDLETLWYEAFPYLCGVCGVLALVFAGHSILFKGSGVLLITASLTIIHLRRSYRRKQVGRIATAAEVARAAIRDDD